MRPSSVNSVILLQNVALGWGRPEHTFFFLEVKDELFSDLLHDSLEVVNRGFLL